MIPIEKTPEISLLLDGLKEAASLFLKYGFNDSKYNYISDFGESIVASDNNAKIISGKPYDLILPDGRTVQVKATREKRKKITCSYRGDEKIDLIAIIEFSKNYDSVYYLYYGPFKEFIYGLNENTPSAGWDNHRIAKKSLVQELQLKYGVFPQPITQHQFFHFQKQ